MDPVSFLIAMTIAAIFLVPALRWPTAGRLMVSLMFAGGALFNLLVTLPNGEVALEALVATSYVPLYRDVVQTVIGWGLSGAFLGLVIAFEATTGLLTLWRGRWTKLALVAAAAWSLGMLPVIPPDGLAIGVALTGAPGIAALLLLRHDYPESVFARIARHLHLWRPRTSPA
jgi:hypothetical protein